MLSATPMSVREIRSPSRGRRCHVRSLMQNFEASGTPVEPASRFIGVSLTTGSLISPPWTEPSEGRTRRDRGLEPTNKQ
jgi:hypothetical protein